VNRPRSRGATRPTLARQVGLPAVAELFSESLAEEEIADDAGARVVMTFGRFGQCK